MTVSATQELRIDLDLTGMHCRDMQWVWGALASPFLLLLFEIQALVGALLRGIIAPH